MKRFYVRLALIAGLLVAIPPTATATEYIRLTGVVQSNLTDRQTFNATIQIRLPGVSAGQILDTAIFYGTGGSYSMVLPKNTPLEIMVSISNSSGFSKWRKSTTFNQDSILNFNIPQATIKISGRMVDAQGNPRTWASVQIGDTPMDAFQISNDGTLWTGSGQSQRTQIDAYGNFVLYSYPTRDIGFKRTLIVQEEYQGLKWISPSFIVDGPMQFVVCLPTNFGASLSLPSYCSQDWFAKAIADKAAAELKTRQEAAELKTRQEEAATAAIEKFEAELKMRQEAAVKAAAAKKATITCIKGKLIKKVTAVKPVCPAGYKLKK